MKNILRLLCCGSCGQSVPVARTVARKGHFQPVKLHLFFYLVARAKEVNVPRTVNIMVCSWAYFGGKVGMNVNTIQCWWSERPKLAWSHSAQEKQLKVWLDKDWNVSHCVIWFCWNNLLTFPVCAPFLTSWQPSKCVWPLECEAFLEDSTKSEWMWQQTWTIAADFSVSR